MNADEFARRALARLRGDATPLSIEDSTLLEQSHTHALIFSGGGVVISDDVSEAGVSSVGAALQRQYGPLQRLIWLPSIEAE